jgi:CheY-like chemotaxis protein
VILNGNHRNWRVLVVEDEALITMEIEDVIEALGYEMVGPVAQLDEALVIAQAGHFDCAILDVNIRGGNTYVIADLLLGRGCPFVMATGYSKWSIPAHLASQKRLTKPYGSRQLEIELREMYNAAQPGVDDALPSDGRC